MKKLFEATGPYDAPHVEIGLMTRREFLDYQNSGMKHHADESYQSDLASLNRDYSKQTIYGQSVGMAAWIVSYSNGYLIYSRDNERQLIGVVHNRTLYYNIHFRMPTDSLPDEVEYHGKEYDLTIDKSEKVKYLSQYTALVSEAAKHNKQEYPVLKHRIKLRDEYFEVRYAKEPEKDAGINMAIFNESGLIVGVGQNEWGATLVMVASEYRGYGLGKLIGKLWLQINPTFDSGGFTDAGQNTWIKIWQDRIRTLLANGWYSEFIKEGKLTKERLKEIIDSAGDMTRMGSDKKEKVESKPKPLIYVEDNISFHIYDQAFFEDQDEKYLYAFGFLRDFEDKTFMFRIDYEQPYAKIATYVAMQMARDEGYKLYVGDLPSDIVEYENLKHVVVDGDYIELSQDVIDLKRVSRLEKLVRKKNDPYSDIYHEMIEMSHSKDWDGITSPQL